MEAVAPTPMGRLTVASGFEPIGFRGGKVAEKTNRLRIKRWKWEELVDRE